MSHGNGRVTVSYGVQENAFMVTVKGKYVRGASYEHGDRDDKIILTHPPTVREIRREELAEKKTDELEGESEAAADGEKAEETDAARKLRLLKAFKAAKYDWMQIQPAKELITLGDKSVVPEMLGILKAKDRRRRCNAGWVLAGLGDERGLAAVLAELKDVGERPTSRTRSDGKPDLKGQIVSDRYYAAHVLGQIGDRRSVPALIEVLRDESIGYQAAIVLGQLGDRRAIPALKELLKNTKNSQRKTEWMYAGYALAKIGDPAGLPVLVDFLTSASWVDRRRAARAMGGIRNSRAVGALVKSLADGNPNVRVAVAEALGEIGDESAIPALQKLFADMTTTTTGRPRAVRDVAAAAIRKIRSAKKPTTQPADAAATKAKIAKFIKQLGADKAVDREKAQQELVKIGGPAVDALHMATKDKNPERAARAKAALAEVLIAVKRQSRIAVYLVSKPADTREAVRLPLAKLTLQREPLLTDSDFVRYDRNKRALVLTADARTRLPRVPSVWGLPFVVVVDGQRWYLGTFMSVESSYGPPIPGTHIDAPVPRDPIGVITPAVGPGTDPKIRKALEAIGAGKAPPPKEPTTQPVDAATTAKIAKPIEQLAAEKAADRETAQRELVTIGSHAARGVYFTSKVASAAVPVAMSLTRTFHAPTASLRARGMVIRALPDSVSRLRE